jgi:hypothetical protein
MAILGFEDKTGPVDAVVFSETYARCCHHLEVDRVLFLKGKVQQRDGTPSLVVDRVIPIENAAELTQGVRVIVRAPNGTRAPAVAQTPAGDGQASAASLAELKDRLGRLREFLLDTAGGPGQVASLRIVVHVGEQVYRPIGVSPSRVTVSGDLTRRVEEILGQPDCCELWGPPRLAIAGGAEAGPAGAPAEPIY